MFTTTSTKKIFFTLIGTLFVLCLFSTIGCNGKYQQELKKVKSERDTARLSLKEAKSNLAAARQSLKTAETARKTAETAKATAETARRKAESNLTAARQSLKTAESNLAAARQSLKTAETAKATAETARKTAESNLTAARQSLKTAETARRKAETDRDNALKLAQIAEEKRKNLEKLVSLVPQAEIKDVRIQEKGKNINISVTFSIKNRKDIESSVKVFFFFKKNGRALRDKNGPISISEKFTPKRIKDTQTVKLSISHAKLNLAQPSDLIFQFRIYDKPTNSFLDTVPYAKEFRFDPHKN